jgi:hypothetical protein
VSTKVDINNLLSASTFNVDADNRLKWTLIIFHFYLFFVFIVDADNLLLLFVFYFFYFSIRVLASTLVDANNLSLVSTFNVDA